MPQSFGPYELIKKMDDGALGDVFLARRAEAGRDPRELVVVKTLNPYLFDGAQVDPEWLEETFALNARLSDPRIVAIFDRGEARGSYFFAMKYVFGDTVHGML